MRSLAALVLMLCLVPVAADDQVDLLTSEERQWLESLGRPLIVGAETGYYPYNFFDDQGRLSGVAGDYVRLLEEKLGIRFDVRSYGEFTELLDAVRTGEADIIPILIAAPERKAYMNFTQSVFESRDRIFVRDDAQDIRDLDELSGKTVGLVEGFALQAKLEADYPEIDVRGYPNEADALLAVSVGSIDAYISEVGTASYYIQREAINNLRVVGEVVSLDPQTFGSRSDFPLLNGILGKGLAAISAEEHAQVQRTWINISGVDPTELNQLWRRIFFFVAIAMLVLLGMLAWTISLRRNVALRTADLQRELAERKRVEAANVRLAVAVGQSAEYVVVVDTRGNIEYANVSFTEARGADSLEGQSFASIISRESKRNIADAFDAARKHGIWVGQVSLSGGNAEIAKVQMTISPIFGQGRLNGFVATGRDVTREVELETQLRQSEKMSALGTLAGGIAHDFNNLLVPIIGSTELIRMQGPDNLAPYVDAIAEAGARARDLVERILVFGQGGTGRQEPLDVRLEIEDSLSFLRSVIPKTVEFRTQLNDAGVILADRTQIQQVLLNLCTNAIDAMSVSGGTLMIALEPRTVQVDDRTMHPELEQGEYALMSVTDSGIGMSKEVQARIFEPYFTRKQQAKGTGLGLATVHGIVTQIGGKIVVRSRPGRGTVFQVFLPTVAVQVERRGEEAGVELRRGDGQMIMVVDDDQLVLGALAVMLQRLGYRVSQFSSPGPAADAFRHEPSAFDAVLTDLSMPGQTGLELIEQIQATQPGLPVALMTGNGSELRECSVRWLAKPISLRDLADCIHEILDKCPL